MKIPLQKYILGGKERKAVFKELHEKPVLGRAWRRDKVVSPASNKLVTS
jgi:hypothetical protein